MAMPLFAVCPILLFNNPSNSVRREGEEVPLIVAIPFAAMTLCLRQLPHSALITVQV